jgi:predicted DNA-binding transcriptional regulator AlpA
MCKKLIRKTTVCEMTGLSYGTIRRLFQAEQFPKPVQLTPGGSVAWFEVEIAAWIESRQVVTAESQRQVAPGNPKRGRPRLSAPTRTPTLQRKSR